MPTCQKQSKGKAVLFIESQPPHIGELLQIISALQHYNFLYVCINPNSIVMPIQNVIAVWNSILYSLQANVKLATFDADLREVSIDGLPSLFKDCVYLTEDRAAFVHLSSLNIKVQLMPKAFGYCGIFLRSAYRQSRAFTYLENKFLTPMMEKR
jgi:hypothetical protein